MGVAELEGKVYVLGGFTRETTSSTINQVYEPATDTWKELAPLPDPRGSVSVAQLKGKSHAIGGRGASDVNSYEAYDPSAGAY